MVDNSSRNLSENYSLNVNLSNLQNQSHNKSLEKNFYNSDEMDLEKLDESTIEDDTDEISSIANSEKEYQITKLRIFKNVYCENCQKVCSVLILDDGSLTIDCECSKNPNEKFIYYCTDCSKDICKKYMEKNVSLYNTENYKICENHTLINLNENKETIETIKKLIHDIENEKKFDEKDEKIIKNIFFIIWCFVENYELYTCYNLMISLQNFKNFYKIYIIVKMNFIN